MSEQPEAAPGDASRYSAQELEQRRSHRAAAARRIDPRTAFAYCLFTLDADPYWDFNLSSAGRDISRDNWLFDPQERCWILEWEVRDLHPDTSDAAWSELMRAAFTRFDEAHPPSEDDIEFASDAAA